MPTDDERRKVARRLRKAIGLTEFAEVLGFNWTDDSDWVWNDVSNLVADFIEPSEQKVRCVAEVKIDGEQLEKLVHDAAVELTGIDREALLALADEIELDGAGSLEDDDWCKPLLVEYAQRIREALEVDDD